MAQAKFGNHLYVVQSHPDCSIKHSEMSATYPGLGDSQAKPSCESRLDAASAMPGLTEASCCLFERI